MCLSNPQGYAIHNCYRFPHDPGYWMYKHVTPSLLVNWDAAVVDFVAALHYYELFAGLLLLQMLQQLMAIMLLRQDLIVVPVFLRDSKRIEKCTVYTPKCNFLWPLHCFSQERIIRQVLICPINTLHEHIILKNTNRFFLYFFISPWNINHCWIVNCGNHIDNTSILQHWRRISPFLVNVVSPRFRDCDSFFISGGRPLFTLIVPHTLTCLERRVSAIVTWL